MSAGWAAASVRSQALARRRYGAAAARALAAMPSLENALERLARSPYGHDVRAGQSLAAAQHAVSATLLWHLRVLAGWVPWDGTRLLRAVAAGYEIANVDARLRRLETGGAEDAPPFQLGALGTLGSRLAGAGSPGGVRAALAASSWGDPGAESDFAIGLHLRLEWARRCVPDLPEAWVPAATAIVVARERYGAGRRIVGTAALTARRMLGARSVDASSLAPFVAALPRSASWAFAGTTDASDLWRAETTWWRRVEADGFRELRAGRLDRTALVGACAVLAVDAWRVRAALAASARGGRPPEVFDEVA